MGVASEAAKTPRNGPTHYWKDQNKAGPGAVTVDLHTLHLLSRQASCAERRLIFAIAGGQLHERVRAVLPGSSRRTTESIPGELFSVSFLHFVPWSCYCIQPSELFAFQVSQVFQVSSDLRL